MSELSQATRDAFVTIVTDHLARYPRMQVEDVYKLAHQACLGSEHAVSDQAHAARWLEREIAELGAGPDEHIVDPIAPGGSIVRVHLRPYLASGGDTAALLEAFVRTANEVRGSTERLAACWLGVEAMALDGAAPFRPGAVRSLGSRLREAGYPALHHSAAFERTYRPAYRVVARALLPTGLVERASARFGAA